MFIDKLLNSGNMPLLEQTMKFTAARENLYAENVANLSTPNYRQKDLSLERFQELLQQRVENPGEMQLPDASEMVDEDVDTSTLLFHDRNNRSVDKLMSDQAQNALMHNLMTELLRKQFAQIQEAIKERPT